MNKSDLSPLTVCHSEMPIYLKFEPGVKLTLRTQNAGSMEIAQLKCQECSAAVVSAEEWLCSLGGGAEHPLCSCRTATAPQGGHGAPGALESTGSELSSGCEPTLPSGYAGGESGEQHVL